jgi:predicted dehydrogenase
MGQSREDTTRRSFISAAGASIVAVAGYHSSTRAASAATRPSIAFIGCGGRAKSLQEGFKDAAHVAWACDPDRERLASFVERSGAEKSTTDLRQVLDDKSVDAVVIATPDHWHAPAAILACQAGKHVYVEKPCSHNMQEGKLLVRAARQHQVVVQHGTQSRTNPLIVKAIQLLQQGAIGEILMAKAWNVQRRRNIGHALPSAPPPAIDYDLWVGPAEFLPYQENRLHYEWHWWTNFGTGDIGNDGTHEIDIARWGLGVSGMPESVMALGGKYYFDDDQQFPDTATCAFEWPGDGQVLSRKQLIFEMRIWSTTYPHNCDTGVEFYGTKGMLFVSKRGKLQMWDEGNKPVPISEDNDRHLLPKNHQIDFLEAMSEGRSPAADIAIGHDSAALVHLANIAVMRGQSLKLNSELGTIEGDEQAERMLGRQYREGGHWAVPRVG